MDEKYQLSGQLKNFAYALIGIGALFAAINIIVWDADSHRIWANVLLNNVFFLLVALAGIFFIAVFRIGNAGWHIAFARIPEAIGTYVPIGGLLLLGTYLIAKEDLFHWTHEDVDAIIEGKRPWLNDSFFILRIVIYTIGWGFAGYMLRRWSLREDREGGIKPFRRANLISSVFLVFFAVTSSTFAWDWIMSIDTHWFSTLFGWYVFASFWVTGLAAITLILIYLRKQGYMSWVNQNHLHDLGKLMFAFTIFWTYLWFAQYMLIWYANIPEETIYFEERLAGYNTYFFLNIVFCFCIPFLILMARDTKRNTSYLVAASLVIVCGHWFDFYLMIMPGILGAGGRIGLLEIGLAFVSLGIFLLIVFSSLAKAPLVAKNHPYIDESLHYTS